MLVFSDGCCPRIDWYKDDEKKQGSFIIQAEKVNGNCYYVLERGEYPFGIWKCEDSWWIEYMIQSSDKGQCEGWWHASTDSNPNLGVQDNSLQWISIRRGTYVHFKLKCVDICL